VVNAEVKYERADYVRAIRFMSRRQNSLFNLMLILGAIIFTLLFLLRATAGDAEWWTVPAVPVVVVSLHFLVRALQVRNISRQLKSAPDAQCVQHWVISDAGLENNSELSNSQIKWGAVIKFRESKSDFFFYTAPRFAKFLPKRALTDGQQTEELRRLAAQNVADCQA
jgi:hypothetical protein